MKDYQAEVKMSDSQIKKMMTGGAVRISHTDLQKQGNRLYRLHFHKLKDLNRYVNNMKSHKGFQLKKSHLSDIKNAEGGALLDFAKTAGHNLGKSFGPVNPFDLGYAVGHDIVDPYVVHPIVQKVQGSGLPKKTTKGKGIKPKKKPILNQRRLTVATKSSSNEDGGSILGTIGKIALPIATKVATDAIVSGMGISSYGLGGDRLLTNPALNPEDKVARMAHARSFIKRGGSFLPIG